MTDQIKETNLKNGLRKWVEQKEISIPDFARQMEYSYNHAYQLLRGTYAAVTAEVIGRIVLVFGAEAAEEILDLANAPVSKPAESVSRP